MLTALAAWAGLAIGLCTIIFGLIVLKDLIAYPLVRSAYVVRRGVGTDRLLGMVGTARSKLDPAGYVRVGPELWQAELTGAEREIEAGRDVEVVGARGNTLLVTSRREPPE